MTRARAGARVALVGHAYRATPGRARVVAPDDALHEVGDEALVAAGLPVTALELEFYLIDRERDAGGAPQPPCCPRSGAREVRRMRSRPLVR